MRHHSYVLRRFLREVLQGKVQSEDSIQKRRRQLGKDPPYAKRGRKRKDEVFVPPREVLFCGDIEGTI